MGPNNIPNLVGMAYAIITILIIYFLQYKENFSWKIRVIFLGISITLGFLIFAPMIPHQFQNLFVQSGGRDQILPLMIIGILLILTLTFIFGRIFCGYVCPIGAIQELVYLMPSKKLKINNKIIPPILRFVFLIFLISMGLLIDIKVLSYFGIRDFFTLSIGSFFFFIFFTLVIISIFIYRPFCRFLCPYGVLLSLTSIKSEFKLRRNDNCTDCKKCETACPTNEAGKNDLKQECYMCNRCREICPVDAIEYVRYKGDEK